MTEDEQAQAVLELLTQRTWGWVDQGGRHTMTDSQILNFYFDHWADQMHRALKQDEISAEQCIQDFVTIYWAWEVK